MHNLKKGNQLTIDIVAIRNHDKLIRTLKHSPDVVIKHWEIFIYVPLSFISSLTSAINDLECTWSPKESPN
jgi:hypothetical protein